MATGENLPLIQTETLREAIDKFEREFDYSWAGLSRGAYPRWMGLTGILDEPTTPKTPLPSRKSAEPIVAWRGWTVSVTKNGKLARLYSVVQGTRWMGPVLTAEKGPPSDHGSDGIYAFDKPHFLVAERFDAWGEVMLYGKVVRHTQGYRAEKAMIRRIVLTPRAILMHESIEDLLSAKYGCEVTCDPRELLRGK